MLRYLTQRLLESVAVLFLVSAGTYVLLGLMPGDPIDLMISGNPELTIEDAQRLRAVYGLDQPILDRYFGWLGQALRGEFGYSRHFSQPAVSVLGDAVWVTLSVAAPALLLAFAIAIPLGLLAALRGGWLNRGINLAALISLSLPTFWLAIVLIYLFAVELRWLPAGGMGEGLAGRLEHLILPVSVLSLSIAGVFLRFTRAAAAEILGQDYVRTAKAKGVASVGLMLRHVLPNAALPLITLTGLQLGALFSGTVIVEILFRQLGMGRVLYDAVLGNDFNLALVALLLTTAATLLGNLLADLSHAWLDPRIGLR
ncbi:MAG: ABC transporter permease [Rhodospirillales bacterium]|nr:ABC transporter permease [Rhodospirillales bacterium]